MHTGMINVALNTSHTLLLTSYSFPSRAAQLPNWCH